MIYNKPQPGISPVEIKPKSPVILACDTLTRMLEELTEQTNRLEVDIDDILTVPQPQPPLTNNEAKDNCEPSNLLARLQCQINTVQSLLDKVESIRERSQL